MLVYGLNIADSKGLTNLELIEYAKKLKIKHFRGVFMRDTLPQQAYKSECGIVNLNISKQEGSHWVAYLINGSKRIYFDSFGQVTPNELQKYLKTKAEWNRNLQVILGNTDIVKHLNTHVCGHLCLFVLTSLTQKQLTYQDVLNILND